MKSLIFLIRKIIFFKKMASKIKRIKESEFSALLLRDPDLFAPVRIVDIAADVASGTRSRYDLFVTLVVGERRFPFVVEVKGRSVASVADGAINQILNKPLPDRDPMIALPYLSESVVTLLKERGVSGIDLNGNYYIVTPGLVAIRLDRPNMFLEPAAIRNVYAGNSSIVGRYLLTEPGPFTRVNDIAEGIDRYGGGLSLATISKVLSAMADDLVVRRRRGTIALGNAAELLKRLRRAYRAPKVGETIRLKLPDDRAEREAIIDGALGADDWIWSGDSAAILYAVTTPLNRLQAWTRGPVESMRALEAYEDPRFFNTELSRTDDAFPFFARNGRWASRIESCLELSQGDKRAKEIGEDIAIQILKELDHVAR